MNDPIKDIQLVCDVARAAGAAIMEVYEGEIAVELKDDKSPLTEADRASHEVIERGLRAFFPDVPILSEEGKDVSYEERQGWKRFWLVDPLDGTKEFVKRNGEFTVNIALIEGESPVAGVVYVPAQNKLYFGVVGDGAWVQCDGGEPRPITVREADPAKGLTVVMSRSHPSPELDAFLKTVKVSEAVSVGSSLKLCVVAEGAADLYPRLGPTMEWDTAAGHAVVVSAGGEVVRMNDLPLVYNKENLLNDFFVVRPRYASIGAGKLTKREQGKK